MFSIRGKRGKSKTAKTRYNKKHGKERGKKNKIFMSHGKTIHETVTTSEKYLSILIK